MSKENELGKIKDERALLSVYGEGQSDAVVVGKIDLANEDEKMDFYNNCLNCEESIDRHLGEKLKVKYIYVEKQEIKNDLDVSTGQPKLINGKVTHTAPRQVYYCEDGKSYITFSGGTYFALKKLIAVYGNPPYPFYLIFDQINKGKSRVYTIKITKE